MKIIKSDLPGIWVSKSEDFNVMSQGRTPQEAEIALTDAVRVYLEAHKRRGTKPPRMKDLPIYILPCSVFTLSINSDGEARCSDCGWYESAHRVSQ